MFVKARRREISGDRGPLGLISILRREFQREPIDSFSSALWDNWFGCSIVLFEGQTMKPVSSRVELRRSAARFSVILVRQLRDSVKYRHEDPAEQIRLGRVVLECLSFRRGLLDNRPGPKWREEKQLQKMEKLVDVIMARLEKRHGKNDLRIGKWVVSNR